MSSIVEIIKTTSEIAVPRAYLIACACEIEIESQKIVNKLVSRVGCPHIYEFLANKQLLGELNFKWKSGSFEKFLKLFGSDFHKNVKNKIINSGHDFERLVNGFETIGANRGSVTHENSGISITLDEISENFELCMKAFEITNHYIDTLITLEKK